MEMKGGSVRMLSVGGALGRVDEREGKKVDLCGCYL